MTFRAAALLLLGCSLASQLVWAAQVRSSASLDAGFRMLYELRFEEARGEFQTWQKLHPQDPLGPTAEAASYLFEEFHRQGVLTSEFFLDDSKLLGGIDGQPDSKLRAGFFAAVERSETMAQAMLRKNPQDADGLYALALVRGMLGNYRALIERKHLEGVRLTERAENLAQELLKIRPDAQDAWLAIGASNYIVGCLSPAKRFFLWFGGISGGRKEGMEQLRRAAGNGKYLRPYAKILLALAALREKQPDLARHLFAELTREFPANPLFARELALLNKGEPHASYP